MTNTRLECHIEVTSTLTHGKSNTAVNLLASDTGLSKQCIKKAMQKGAVWLSNSKGTHRQRRHSSLINKGETIHLYYDEAVLEKKSEAAQLISDEGGYSVWHKPYGMLSQGSKWGDHCVINRWIEQNTQPQRPCFIVHRLDRAARGLIIIAHKKKLAAQLSKQFQDRDIKKCYQVLAIGNFSQQQQEQTIVTINEPLDQRSACSHISIKEYNSETNQSLLDVSIETGRKHQIRRHLARLGYPVVGDRLYGGETPNNDDLQLLAYSLAFSCPIDKCRKIFTLPDSLLLHSLR